MLLIAFLSLAVVGATTVGLVFQRWSRKLDEDRNISGSFYFVDLNGQQQVQPLSILEEPTKSLSVIFPAYNEEDRLIPTLNEAISYLDARRVNSSGLPNTGASFTYEIIVVDDGSKDGTVKSVHQYMKQHGQEKVRVLSYKKNQGKGRAVKTGMLAARGKVLLMADSDGATRFSQIEVLERELEQIQRKEEQGAVGMVFGSRAHLENQAIAQRSQIRNILMYGFHFLVRLVAGGRVRDTQCGFKLFTRRSAKLLYMNQRLKRFCFDVELLKLAQHFKHPIGEKAVYWTEIGGSKVKPYHVIHMALEMMLVKYCYDIVKSWRIRGESELRA